MLKTCLAWTHTHTVNLKSGMSKVRLVGSVWDVDKHLRFFINLKTYFRDFLGN